MRIIETDLPLQLNAAVPGVAPLDRRMRGARLGAIAFMTFCLATFVWGALLFPRFGVANLDIIRPNANWGDVTLLAVIADAGLSVAMLSYFQFVLTLLVALSMVTAGLVIFWRRADSWFGLYVGVLFVWFGTQGNYVTAPVGRVLPPLAPILDAIGILVWLAFFPLLYLFPDGRFVPHWTRWLLPVWLGINIAFVLKWLPEGAAYAAIPLYLAIGIGSQGYRYFRRSGAVQRQQTKWVLAALALVVLTGVFAIVNLAVSRPDSQLAVGDFWVATIAATLFSLSLAALPISIGIAILRYRLWDIDVIIRKTLVYAVLTALLALVYFGGVIVLQRLFGALTGVEQSPLAVVVSTLAIAALFTPLRRRIQDGIDRRFYRKKYDAQQVLAQFALTARDETDLDALTGELARVVQDTMQPERVSVWLRDTRKR